VDRIGCSLEPVGQTLFLPFTMERRSVHACWPGSLVAPACGLKVYDQTANEQRLASAVFLNGLVLPSLSGFPCERKSA